MGDLINNLGASDDVVVRCPNILRYRFQSLWKVTDFS
jgi:hypothetical protein